MNMEENAKQRRMKLKQIEREKQKNISSVASFHFILVSYII